MFEMLVSKRTTLIITALTALLLIASACSSSTSQQSNIPEVVIKASDFAYEAPEQIEAGLTYIKMENTGEELHHVQLLRLNDDVTMDQFMAALQEGPEAALPLVTLHGGNGMLPKGSSSRVAVDLPEGQYVLVCFVESPDGMPHLAKGMIKPLLVVAKSSAEVVEAPQANVEIVMKDFNFVLPDEIKSGKQTWKISNEGPQPHEMALFKLAPNMTLADVQSYMQTMEGPPPFEPFGGLQGIMMGDTGYLELDLDSGSYFATCYIPDPASGKPHLDLGMLMQFEVQ